MAYEAPRAPDEAPGTKASAITHVITFSSATPPLQRCSLQPHASPASLRFNVCESAVAALTPRPLPFPKLDTVCVPSAATEATQSRQDRQNQGEGASDRHLSHDSTLPKRKLKCGMKTATEKKSLINHQIQALAAACLSTQADSDSTS